MSFTPSAPVTATDITALAAHLTGLGTGEQVEVGAGERIDQLRALEALKAAVAAAQVRVTAALAADEQQEQRTAAQSAGSGFEAWQARRELERCRPSVGAQVGLARRLSPHQGARQVSLAKALVEHLPCTLTALERGVISEWRATIIARESSSLTATDRGSLDAEIATDLDQLASWGDRELTSRVRAVAYRLDAQTAVDRAARAVTDRRVSLRPAPDAMSQLAALLPVQGGVAVYTSLEQAAVAARAQGDVRSRGQVMADTLVERVTGQASATAVPVEVQVVMSDTALLGDEDSPALVSGYGPIPAGIARDLLKTADRDAKTWLRRLYAHPGSGALTQVESRRRTFPPGLRRFITNRDQTCRTPWCDAPIRHLDHIRAHSDGGTTSLGNGQGLCERCNYTKQAPGWTARTLPGERAQPHRVRVTTPTGHTYDATAPPVLPGRQPPLAVQPDACHSALETEFVHLLSA